ncbi:MAG: ABC transporter permease [Clostridium sp.]|jgi:lipoprotein-releasing system permease protein|nr:ABC transporter permease [Clostridium sp.]
MKLAFSIALRFLSSNKGQTLLIAFGIAIGVSVQIFIGSLIQGLQISLVDTTIGNQPQITIESLADDKLILDYETILKDISSNSEGVKFVSASADGPALMTVKEDTFSILVRGLSYQEAEGIYKIKKQLVDGNLPENKDETIIGTDLAEEANLAIGDELEVLAAFGETYTLKITGIFDLQVASLNSSWVLTSIETGQSMFSYGNAITGIEMQVDDVFAADTIAQDIQSKLPANLNVNNWKAENAALLSGLNGQSISSYMIQLFVMVSVLLGIASVLAITVVQKSRQIGILKAMGIQDRAASQIFLLQGFMLGIAGAILGVLLGLGLAFAFTKFAVNPDGNPVVPLFIDPAFIAFSASFAIVVSTLAALIPARRSSNLSPIEVIRNA